MIGPPSAKPAYSIWLNGHPPTANELHRMHWRERAESRTEWKNAVYYTVRERYAKQIVIPLSRVTVSCTWVYQKRRSRDIDNLVASLKPILDGLVLANCIPDDDSDTVTSLVIHVVVDPNTKPGLLVEVYSTGNTP